MPSSAALVSSSRKPQSLCPKEVFFVSFSITVQVRGTPSDKSSITGDPMANTSCPFMHWCWPCTCRKSPAEVKKKIIVSLVEWRLQFGLLRLRINPRRCEIWCQLDEVTREKLSNTWQSSAGLQLTGFAIGMRSNRIENSIRFGAWSTKTFGRFGRIFRFNFRSRARSSSETVESNRNSVC